MKHVLQYKESCVISENSLDITSIHRKGKSIYKNLYIKIYIYIYTECVYRERRVHYKHEIVGSNPTFHMESKNLIIYIRKLRNTFMINLEKQTQNISVATDEGPSLKLALSKD